MSDFSQNNQELNEQVIADETVSETTVEESSIFSAPVEHNDKAPKNANKKRFVSIIAAALAVAILIGGTIAVIKFIPELKEDETSSQVFEDIPLLDEDSKKFTAVNVTNSNGTFKFTTKQITATNDKGQTNTTTYWTVSDIDVSKLSTDATNTIISATSSITALREIDTKTKEECGFNKPTIKVSVETQANKNFAFSVGDKSPDGLGYYFMLDGSDKIYVVPASEVSDLQFKLIDLADKTAIPIMMFDTDTSANKAADGSYAYFDSITLSGALFRDVITIENNKEENESADIVPYIITTPTKRYAQKEKVPSLINLFSKTINVAGSYAFEINDKTLKEFRLDKPDAIVTLTINGESKSFKISKIDSEFCAVVYDGATMIRKVTSSSFEFLTLKAEDFYNKQPFMYSINDLSSLELIDDENKIKFDISSSEDAESNRTFHIKANGKKIDTPTFQTFYSDFVGIQYNDFTVEQTSEDPISSVIFTFKNGSKTTIDFYKINETKYQFSINDAPMGRITSAAYKKMIKAIKEQAENTNAE